MHPSAVISPLRGWHQCSEKDSREETGRYRLEGRGREDQRRVGGEGQVRVEETERGQRGEAGWHRRQRRHVEEKGLEEVGGRQEGRYKG